MKCRVWLSDTGLSVVRRLGTVAQGASCRVLQERFRADTSPSSLRGILVLLRQQPGPLHTSLVHSHVEPAFITLYLLHIYYTSCVDGVKYVLMLFLPILEKVCDRGALPV